MFGPLTERQKQILWAIVEDYVETMEPVGSRTISKRYPFGLSPATIRNEMADLEENGYLQQPHTSAGRIPSDAGYRIFVSELMGRPLPMIAQEEDVRLHYQNTQATLEEILHTSAHLLSLLSSCVAIVSVPRSQQHSIRYLHFVYLHEREIMVAVGLDNQLTNHHIIRLSQDLPPEALNVLTNFLNQRLKGLPVEHLLEAFKEAGEIEPLSPYLPALREIAEQLRLILRHPDKVYTSGASNILRQPEFHDAEKTYPLISLLEQDDQIVKLLELLRPDDDVKAQVAIGTDHPFDPLYACSTVTAHYQIGEKSLGTIGLIGPTRMRYSHALSTVNLMARVMSDWLTKLYQEAR